MPGRLSLYHNDGTGRFQDVALELGLPEVTGDVKNPIWIDYDRDGDLDLIVVRALPSMADQELGLFENRGDEGFVRVPTSIFPGDAIAFEELFVFAVAVEDFDQDGWEDVYLGRWGHQDHVLRNRGDGTFEPLGADIGLDASSELNTMGLGVGDMNGDGYPDVFVGPGTPALALPPVLYCNVGYELRFERCEGDFEAAVPLARWHGAAFGDLNRDFKTDVVLNPGGFATYDRDYGEDTADWLLIFINHGVHEGNKVRVRLVGTASPTLPVGAQLRLDASRHVYRSVHSSQGFQSFNDEWMVLPMGEVDIATAHVRWPSGHTEAFTVTAWTEAELVEGAGIPSDAHPL